MRFTDAKLNAAVALRMYGMSGEGAPRIFDGDEWHLQLVQKDMRIYLDGRGLGGTFASILSRHMFAEGLGLDDREYEWELLKRTPRQWCEAFLEVTKEATDAR